MGKQRTLRRWVQRGRKKTNKQELCWFRKKTQKTKTQSVARGKVWSAKRKTQKL